MLIQRIISLLLLFAPLLFAEAISSPAESSSSSVTKERRQLRAILAAARGRSPAQIKPITLKVSPAAFDGKKDPDLNVLSDESQPLPQMLVFDLDSTLWPSIDDAAKSGLYDGVADLLVASKRAGLQLALASQLRTPDSDAAQQVLKIQMIPDSPKKDAKTQSAFDMFSAVQTKRQGNRKFAQLKKIRETSGVPFQQMVLFDGQDDNKDVKGLKITFTKVDPKTGVTKADLRKGIESWRARVKELQDKGKKIPTKYAPPKRPPKPRDPKTVYSKNKNLKVLFETDPLPKMLVFDLDATLWETSSLRELVADAPSILLSAQAAGIKLAVASLNTGEDKTARILKDIIISTNSNRPAPGDNGGFPIQKGEQDVLSMFEKGAVLIKPYTKTKKWHFDKLRAATKIAYSDMLFFDDKPSNKDVEDLGVTMQLVNERTGITKKDLKKGVEAWRKRRKSGSPDRGRKGGSPQRPRKSGSPDRQKESIPPEDLDSRGGGG